MILLVDVGNTNTVIGLSSGDLIVHSWRIETSRNKTKDEYLVTVLDFLHYADISVDRITDAIMASVVPELNEPFRLLCLRLAGKEPLMVGPGIKTGMPIRLDNPREVGADRIANGVAAFNHCQQACVVIDFGTAITYDVVSEQGEYIGGAICPGPRMSAESLGKATSKLPVVDIERPNHVIGKNTQDSVKSGLFYGYLAQIEGMVSRIEKEMEITPKVLATGGLADLFFSHTKCIHEVNQDLTLRGLKIIYDRNNL